MEKKDDFNEKSPLSDPHANPEKDPTKTSVDPHLLAEAHEADAEFPEIPLQSTDFEADDEIDLDSDLTLPQESKEPDDDTDEPAARRAQHYKQGDDPLASYLRHIQTFPMLRPEDEYTLAHQWIATKDKCAQDQIIGSHLRLVSKIAQGYRGYGMPILDLISEGHMGLLKALENFDPDRGARFSTYALLWIKAHMKDYVIRNWSLVKTGTTAAQKKLFFKLRAKTHAVLDEGQRFLDDEQIVQISKDLNVPEKTVVEMTTRLAGSDYSLNTPISVGEDSDGEWQDWLEDETDSHDMKIAEQDELKKRMMVLKNALHVLKPRELQILQRRRLQEPPHTLEEIGLALNLSRERVRQLEVSAFLKIQKSVRTHVQEKFQGM